MGKVDFCRLCAEKRAVVELSYINDEYWSVQNFDLKIFKFFQIRISPSDRLSKCICNNCCEKVNVTWEFNEKIQQAQDTLKSLLLNEEYDGMYEKKQSFVSLVNFQKSHKSPSFEFVECILQDSEQPKSKKHMTKNREILLNDGSTILRRKKVIMKNKKESTDKQRTIRIKKRKDRSVSANIHKHKIKESEEDKLSVLSGASDADKNEDGSLTLHRKLETWESYPWICVECNEKLSSIIDLRSHHQTIHNQMPKYACVECPKVYSKYYGFIAHVRCHRYHLRFCCDACNKFFANRKVLEAHRSIHFDARPYICHTCGKNFRMQSALYVHARSHLPIELKNRYSCDLCPKKFGTKPNLMAHKRIHTGIRDYICNQCGKSFIQKGNLDNHMLTHIAERPFICETCGKAFKTLMRLKKHGSVHTGLKPHRCEVCGRQFREKGTLKEHLRIHTGAMPFKCEFCEKSFRFKGVLTTHRRQHTGERPYSCHDCQHHFTNWPNYNKHMKRRHGINTSLTTRKTQNNSPTDVLNRNLPATVIAPNTQVIVIQNTEDEANSNYLEQDHGFMPQTNACPVINHQKERVISASNTNSIISGQLLNMSSSHITQTYYMPSMLSFYNIQGMNPDIIQQPTSQ